MKQVANTSALGLFILLLQHVGAQRSTKLEWPECVEQKMTVQQCHELIVSETAEGHFIENIEVGRHYPSDVLTAGDVIDGVGTGGEELYYRFAVPTNYMGQAHGFGMDGQMTYTGLWNGVGSGPREIGPWSCAGKTATQCCDWVKRNVKDRDVNGNYIDCWVQQQHPSPYEQDGRITYCAWEWESSTRMYVPKEVGGNRLEKVYDFSMAKLDSYVFPEIVKLLETGRVPYAALDSITNHLHFHARTSASLQRVATEMDAYLHAPYDASTIFPMTPEMEDLLIRTKTDIQNVLMEPFEIRHVVLIHSNDLDGSTWYIHQKSM